MAGDGGPAVVTAGFGHGCRRRSRRARPTRDGETIGCRGGPEGGSMLLEPGSDALGVCLQPLQFRQCDDRVGDRVERLPIEVLDRP